MAGTGQNSNLNLRGGGHECVGLSWGRDKHGYPVLLEHDHDPEETEKFHHHDAGLPLFATVLISSTVANLMCMLMAVVVKLCNAMKEKWASKLDGETGGVAMRRGKAGGNQVHDSGYKKGARLVRWHWCLQFVFRMQGGRKLLREGGPDEERGLRTGRGRQRGRAPHRA